MVAIDPVCGMEIDEQAAKFRTRKNGKDVYFCCPHCKARFESEPAKFMQQG